MVKIYFENLKRELKTALEYKTSFIFNLIGQSAYFFSLYYMILALFDKFSNVKGYTKYEVLLCFAIINIGFSINEVFFRGIDTFDELIIDGSLDRLLLRPYNVLIQVLWHKMDLVKIARIFQAFIILVISISKLNLVMTIDKIILVIMMIISSSLIFLGLLIISASYNFFTIQGLEIKNLLTDGGKHMAQYPIGIFKKGFIFIFTFIIPYASINYYPLLYLLGKSNSLLYYFSPLLVIVYFIPCLFCFKLGLKHYNSVGS